ncbi:MAG: YdcF family protein [Deltaproteobacteria bacterium]|nr:YdcF family protein [Deltaproteobacteria bacterium]
MADAIVVLGCRVRADGRPGAFLAARVRAAAAAHREAPEIPVVLSGGRRWNGISEAEAMRHLAVELGIVPNILISEEMSMTTAGNAQETRRILGDGARVALVTQAFHASRAVALFRRAGLVADWLPAETPSIGPWMRARLTVAERIAEALDRVRTG